MNENFSRFALLVGEEGIEKLSSARIAVFGVGGVGGYAVEALARSGVGALDVIDNDIVSPSNINRQIIATTETIGRSKVDVAEERIKSINPDCIVRTYKAFFLPDTADLFDFSLYEYVIDAIDTVSGKIELAVRAKNAGVPLISCMGAGNKLDPTAFEVADLFKTTGDPLARIMRRELRKRGIERLKVVCSSERAIKPKSEPAESAGRRSIPGSAAFVPSVAGLIAAGTVINDILGRIQPPGKGE